MAKQESDRHGPCGGFIPEEALQHVRAAHRELYKSAEALLPPGFFEHRPDARKEMLLAARSVIDAAIERVEAHERAQTEA